MPIVGKAAGNLGAFAAVDKVNTVGWERKGVGRGIIGG